MTFFVVVEGLTGVGKTCLSLGLKKHLYAKHTLILTEEPNKKSFAYKELRKMLNLVKEADQWTQALAFAANRADHNRQVIKPFLRTGQKGVLICDRYYHSSLVYQSNHEITYDDLLSINRYAEEPDLTLFLDASVKNILQRLEKRPRNKERFHKNLEDWREKYLSMVEFLQNKDRVIEKIDANKPIDSVLNDSVKAIFKHGPSWLRD